MRVLIIESCVEQSERLRCMLNAVGHDAINAGTPREAVVLAPRFLPQVVVSELFPVGDDHYGWWRKLYREPALAETRFIAVLSRWDAPALAQAREAGFEYVLANPVDAFSLDEYLVGVSSPRWRRSPAGTHPWPEVVSLALPPAVTSSEEAPEEIPGREALAGFLQAMRDLAEAQDSNQIYLLGPLEVPPVALLRHLNVVRGALDAACSGDKAGGRQILQDGLTIARDAAQQPWSEALCARYQLALRTYCALHLMDGVNPG